MQKLLSKIHEWFKIPYKLHVEQVGEGPAVIMLHGIASSSISWSHLIPLLNERFRCITIDLVGFGKSPKPGWYSYTPEEHIACLHRTIKSLKLNEPHILVGHSMGSLLALSYASKYTDEVSRLIILSPPVYFNSKETKMARIKWREIIYARAYKYIRRKKNLAIKGSKGISRIPRNNSFEINEETWIAFSKSLEECIEKQNIIADLGNVTCPVDVFYGSLDQLIIKTNIQILSKYEGVSIHSVRSGHLISKYYAQIVAGKLSV